MISSVPKVPDFRAQEVIGDMQTELKATALAVRRWRKEHVGPMSGLAVELQRRVVKLLESHSWEAVCQAVGISRSQLAAWRREHKEHLGLRRRQGGKRPGKRSGHAPGTFRGKTPTKTTAAAGFIELPVREASAGLEVEVRLPSGVVVHARSNSDAGVVGELVTQVLAGAQGAA